MKAFLLTVALVPVLCAAVLASADAPNTLTPEEQAAGWQLLFDGRTLDGWQASDAPGTFSVNDGHIVVHGPRSHLYYTGPIANHDFRNFELELDVLTLPGSNSGVYFHTAWQPTGWPEKGYEVQVNNTQRDPKRTAGLYDIRDNYARVADDDTWFTLRIRVQGKHIVTSVDGAVVVDFSEPENWTPPANHLERRIASGTFALQGHDPKGEVHYRNIKVRPLP